MEEIKPIYGKNISEAWALAYNECFKMPGGLMAPAIISFDINEADASWQLETKDIRYALDKQLIKDDESSIETVAGTIFPESVWMRCNGDREKLFMEYNRMWPYVSKCRQNRHGTYFRRLSSFGTNQLKAVIETWHSGTHRHSALQSAIFDPAKDHSKARQLGFPCLQQVVFHPKGINGSEGMTVVAFYANQLLVEKAYGNYLGLYRLGKFMAGEMGLRLKGVTCIASNLSLGKHGKKECQHLLSEIKRVLSDAN